MNNVTALTVTRVEAWLNESRETRLGQKEFRKDLHISYPRFAQIVQEIKVRKASTLNQAQTIKDIRLVMENTLTGKPIMKKTIERAQDILDVKEEVLVKATKNSQKMKDAVVQSLFRKAVDKGDHNAAFRLAQIKGWIVEKKEETIKIDGRLIAQAIIRAERELRDSGYGVGEMPNESVLLHPELRLLPGQGKGENGQVRTVASSDSPAESISTEPPDNNSQS